MSYQNDTDFAAKIEHEAGEIASAISAMLQTFEDASHYPATCDLALIKLLAFAMVDGRTDTMSVDEVKEMTFCLLGGYINAAYTFIQRREEAEAEATTSAAESKPSDEAVH